MNAVKNYNGKDFGGNKISVKKVENYVINLSQKRQRSPDRQALSLIPESKVISLAGKRVNQEINLNGQVFLGSGKSGIAKKEEFKGKNEEIPEIKTQTIKQENLPIIEKKPEIQEKKVIIKETDSIKPKEQPSNPETKAKNEEEKVSKEGIKEDSLMIELEGYKFLKTADENKLHCVLCNKEITKKGLKAHIISKAHKSLA